MATKVYLLEDEEWIRRGLKKMICWQQLDLQLAGEAEDGRQAVEEILAMRPHILLSDIRVPVLSGLEVARQVRQVLPALRVIFISGYREFEYAQQAIDLGSVKYLLKPIDDKELNQALAQTATQIRREEGGVGQLRKLLQAPTPSRATMQRLCMGMELGEPVSALMADLLGDASRLFDLREQLPGYLANVGVELLAYLRGKGFILEPEEGELEKLGRAPREEQDAAAWMEGWLEGLSRRIAQVRVQGIPQIVERVKDYIDHSYTREISLNQLAERFYVSTPYLSSAFKKGVGQNFQDYVQQKRVDKAAEILRDTRLSVAEIAAVVGYDDVRHFSRTFRKRKGMTPSEYRAAGGPKE